ncbi:MAG: GNAT family N-acetyltransferase [Chloroflexi bacterium]|nr:GNAT family N-acetyltransferase [Chloroflexota bacterium]
MISVRDATLGDADPYLRLFAELSSLAFSVEPSIFVGSDPLSAEWFRIQLDQPHMLVLVAEDDRDGVIGILRAHVGSTPESRVMWKMEIGYIHELVVAKAHRNRDVATMLLDRVHEWLSSQGVHQVRTTLWSFQAEGQSFFGARGYRLLNSTYVREA